MRKFRIADLCDDHKDKKIQVLSSKYKNYGGKKIFHGKVKTIKLEKSNWGLIDILKNESGENIVLVVNVNEDYFGVVGDKLSLLAEEKNYEAIIVNGYIRDSMETNKFDIGLYALGICPLRNFDKDNSQVGLDLSFGNVLFRENDYVYSDEDGVIICDELLLT